MPLCICRHKLKGQIFFKTFKITIALTVLHLLSLQCECDAASSVVIHSRDGKQREAGGVVGSKTKDILVSGRLVYLRIFFIFILNIMQIQWQDKKDKPFFMYKYKTTSMQTFPSTFYACLHAEARAHRNTFQSLKNLRISKMLKLSQKPRGVTNTTFL